MKFTFCFGITFLTYLVLLINQTEATAGTSLIIGWEIKKLEYFKGKLQAIKEKMITDLQFLNRVEQALLESIIDALRRLQNMSTTIRSNEIKDEEKLKLFDHCAELIRKYEQIEETKKNQS